MLHVETPLLRNLVGFRVKKTFEVYHKIVKLKLKLMLNVRLIHHE